MRPKSALAALVGALEEANVVIDTDIPSGGLHRTVRQLDEFEFKVASPDGDVIVWLTASGKLRELIIAKGALQRHNHREMATLITETIQSAENVMAEGVRELARRQSARRMR